MPPKAPPKAAKENKKADLAKKQKIVEDKTFGLKNKSKSKSVQKYVQSLHQSVQAQSKRDDDPKAAQKKKKEEEAQREKELNELFKVAISQPKVPVETMEDWDQETLEKVVESKGKEYSQNKPTEIVCKYFLEAVEKKQYGWFWVCPNGGKECHYRHALPSGYVLKSQMKALLEEEGEKVTIEEDIENQRLKLKTTTPLTTELFAEWKRKKQEEKDAELANKRAERARNDRMSGRELFASDASLFVDDIEATERYQREEEPAIQDPSSTGQETQGGIRPNFGETSSAIITEEDELLLAEDDDDLDPDELEELEARIASSSMSDDR